MSKDAISKVWTAVGIAVLVLVANAILRVQGSEVLFPTVSYEKAERYSTAVYGLSVTALPYYLLVRLAKLYRRRYGDGTWSGSIPIAFELDISPADRVGKEFQLWVISLFYLLPIVCRFLLLRKLFKAAVYDQTVKMIVVPNGIIEHLGNPFPIDVVFGSRYTIGSLDGVTYFPFWQSWAHLIVEIGLWIYVASFFVSLARDWRNARAATGAWKNSPWRSG